MPTPDEARTYHDEDGVIDGQVIESTERALAAFAGREEMDTSLAVAISRSELDQKIVTAQANPRRLKAVLDRIMTLATLDTETAWECRYAVPRGKDDNGKAKEINGPSVRLAEMVASQWGNCRAGARVTVVDKELGFVEAEGAFHDLETNYEIVARVRRSIRGRPWQGKPGKIFSDDMINVTGNAACSIAFRNAVLKGVPKAMWRPAYQAVEGIIRGDVTTLAARRVELLSAFNARGIKPETIYALLGVKGEVEIGLDELVTARGFFSGLKNGDLTAEDLIRQAAPPSAPGIANPNGAAKTAAQAAATLDAAAPKRTTAPKATVPAKEEPKKAEPARLEPTVEDVVPKREDPADDGQAELEAAGFTVTRSEPTAPAADLPDIEEPPTDTSTSETDPDVEAYMREVDAADSWPAIQRVLSAYRKTPGFLRSSPEDQEADIRRAHDVALALPEPPDPKKDPTFYGLWVRFAAAADVKVTFPVLMRTAAYAALDNQIKDALCEATDRAKAPLLGGAK